MIYTYRESHNKNSKDSFCLFCFFLTRLYYHGTACVCIQGWEGNFLIDERQTKNTIHYHPLQAISFPTALLSETILFIDGKINHQREGSRNKWNQWRICIHGAYQLAADKGMMWFRDADGMGAVGINLSFISIQWTDHNLLAPFCLTIRAFHCLA